MTHAANRIQTRRKGLALLLLPLFAIPLLAALGWLFPPAQAQESALPSGINPILPPPSLGREDDSKPAAYELAKEMTKEGRKDHVPLPSLYPVSLEWAGDQKSHPEAVEENQGMGLDIPPKFIKREDRRQNPTEMGLEEQEALIVNQLRELEALMGGESALAKPPVPIETPIGREGVNHTRAVNAIDRVDSSRPSVEPLTGDSELKELNELTDKLLELQRGLNGSHQNLDAGKMEISPEKVLSVHRQGTRPENLHGAREDRHDGAWEQNGFFGLEPGGLPGDDPWKRQAFRAVLAKTQQILPGEVLELRLEEDLVVGEEPVPTGTMVFAKTSLSGNRLLVEVEGLFWKDRLLPLKLSGFGEDARQGLQLAGINAVAEAASEGGDSLDGLSLLGMGTDWQSQVANTGIQASKKLLRTKNRAKPITLKAGHPLYLVDLSNNGTGHEK